MATRWGCIGPGKISFDFFTAIKENLSAEEHEFVAVASRDQSRAQKFADEFKFKRAYGSYDELAQDKDVEVVYIGTIHTTHVELSLKMLEAGKHVLCEKPMAMNWKQAKMVLDKAKEKNLLFVEGIWSSFNPAYLQIKKDISNGSVGDVRLVEAHFCVPISEVERLKKIELGGGGLLDIGIYVVHLACWVFQEMPESITAVGNLMETGADECACITLKYKNGAMACLNYHTGFLHESNNALIFGTKGNIVLPEWYHCSTKVTTPTGNYDFPIKDSKYNFKNSANFQYEAAAVRECILKGKTEADCVTHKDSEMVMKIMDEVRRQIGVTYPAFDS